ncbi:unnamed protein product [Merluccius merluccius]
MENTNEAQPGAALTSGCVAPHHHGPNARRSKGHSLEAVQRPHKARLDAATRYSGGCGTPHAATAGGVTPPGRRGQTDFQEHEGRANYPT